MSTNVHEETENHARMARRRKGGTITLFAWSSRDPIQSCASFRISQSSWIQGGADLSTLFGAARLPRCRILALGWAQRGGNLGKLVSPRLKNRDDETIASMRPARGWRRHSLMGCSMLSCYCIQRVKISSNSALDCVGVFLEVWSRPPLKNQDPLFVAAPSLMYRARCSSPLLIS